MKEIALEFGISERAIRYDLDEIDRFLLKNDHEVLTRKSNFGISFNFSEKERPKLFKSILDERQGTFFDTPQSRLMDILFKLTFESEAIFIDGESERLMVSRSTVFKDFEKLRQLFNKEKIFLESGVTGFKLSGEEIALRLEISKIMMSLLEPRDIVEIVDYVSGKENFLFSIKISKLFEGIDMDRFKRAISMITAKKGEITDTVYVFTALALAISIKRKDIFFGNIEREGHPSKSIVEVAEIIYTHPCDGEKIYIMELSKYIETILKLQEKDVYFPDLQLLSYKLISIISKSKYQVKSTKKLLSQISEEIINIIFDDLRSKYSQNVTEILSKEKELAVMVKNGIKQLEVILKREIDDYDIVRLYEIFLVENERSKKGRQKKNVLVLCPFDKGYSTYICDRLRSNFEVNVFEGKSLKNIEKDIEENEIETVVSTIKLNLMVEENIKISSSLTKEDLFQLRENLPLREVDANLLKGVHLLVKKYIKANRAKNLTREIGDLLNVPLDFIFQEERNFKTVFSPERICLDYSCSGYEEALNKVGSMLKDDDLVKEGYVKAIIEEVKLSKSHMVVGEGIVLAHSIETNLVNSLGVSILRLKGKVPFIEEGDEKCHLIFGISPTDAESHLDVLEEISRVLLDEKSYEILENSNDPFEVYKLFVRDYEN